MQVSHPNEHGVPPEGHCEIVASRGRSYASIRIAVCVDGQFRYGLDVMYSHGGFCSPICANSDGYPTLAAARTAAIEQMLRQWHTPFPSEPESIRVELPEIRREVSLTSRTDSVGNQKQTFGQVKPSGKWCSNDGKSR
jgi:hypothetical protein